MSVRENAIRVAVAAVAGVAVATLAAPAQAAGNGGDHGAAPVTLASTNTDAKYATPAPTGTPGYFLADGVNIRTGPGTGRTIVGKGYRGQRVTMHCLAPSNRYWINLTNHATGVTGYAYGTYVRQDGGPFPPDC